MDFRALISRNLLFNTRIYRVLALALFCAAFASMHARADQDQVQFFSNIHISADETVHDAVCFFCSVDIEGKSTGDTVVFFGNTHIATQAGHDVVNFFGTITADDNATLGHDVVSMFGGVRLGNDVHVGDDLVTMFGSLQTGDNVTIDGDRTVTPAVLFWGPSIFFIVVIVLLVREFRAYRRRVFLRSYGFPPRP